MKFIAMVSLWNRDQWTYIRYPHNWLKVKRDQRGVLVVTLLGFTVFLETNS